MKRVDADDFGGKQGMGPLFAAPEELADDPFAYSKQEPTAVERVVAGMIWRHKGRANPIAIDKIGAVAGLDARGVKDVVTELIQTHRMLIGGRRGEPNGYFVILDAEDLKLAVDPFVKQIMAMHVRVKHLRQMAEARGIAGQCRIGESGTGV